MSEVKPKWRGWKEGVLTKTLRSVGGTVLLEGSIVRAKRRKAYDEDGSWTGEYEWHYIDQTNYNLIRGDDNILINETTH